MSYAQPAATSDSANAKLGSLSAKGRLSCAGDSRWLRRRRQGVVQFDTIGLPEDRTWARRRFDLRSLGFCFIA